jgi:hypothetical protein
LIVGSEKVYDVVGADQLDEFSNDPFRVGMNNAERLGLRHVVGDGREPFLVRLTRHRSESRFDEPSCTPKSTICQIDPFVDDVGWITAYDDLVGGDAQQVKNFGVHPIGRTGHAFVQHRVNEPSPAQGTVGEVCRVTGIP